MILGLRLIGILFSLSMIYFAVLHFKKREITIAEITSWIIIWLFTIITILFPDLIQPFARNFLFARVLDMLIVGAFILVLVMTTRTYITGRKLERKIEMIVRDMTLKEVNKKNKK